MIAIATYLYNFFNPHVRSLSRVFLDPITLSLSAMLGGIITCIHQAWDRDHVVSWELITGLATLIIIDTFLGVWKHTKLGTISSSGFGSFAGKVIIYVLFEKTVEQIAGIKILEWTGDVLISALLIREAISIIENMASIRPELIPGWILKRLKDFDEDGKINQK